MILSENNHKHIPAPTNLLLNTTPSPTVNKTFVCIKEVLDDNFMKASPVTLAIGKDAYRRPIHYNLAKDGHLLIAGKTGSGKSICLHSMLMSILCKSSPDEVRLILVDTKYVEFSCYNHIPHLLMPVITDSDLAISALEWLLKEAKERCRLFATYDVHDIDEYNNLAKSKTDMPKMPSIVIMIDEFIDMFWSHKEKAETAISRLAVIGKVAGIFMVMATQQPPLSLMHRFVGFSFPSRIAFALPSSCESRAVIDCEGAKDLRTPGAMLYQPSSSPNPIKAQGAFVSYSEIDKVTTYLATQ